jgi:hypothetical protein
MSPAPVNEGSTGNTPSHGHSPIGPGMSPVVVFVPGLVSTDGRDTWSPMNCAD